MDRPDRPVESNRAKLFELALALGVIVFGAVVLWQTSEIRVGRAFSTVGPRVIPTIVGSGLLLIGVILAVQALIGHHQVPTTDSEDADPTRPTDWPTVGLIALALIVYLLLIERAGFVLASGALYAIATFAMGNRRLIVNLAIGLILAAILFVIFTRGLSLSLPEGLLEGIM